MQQLAALTDEYLARRLEGTSYGLQRTIKASAHNKLQCFGRAYLPSKPDKLARPRNSKRFASAQQTSPRPCPACSHRPPGSTLSPGLSKSFARKRPPFHLIPRATRMLCFIRRTSRFTSGPSIRARVFCPLRGPVPTIASISCWEIRRVLLLRFRQLRLHTRITAQGILSLSIRTMATVL